MNIEKNKVSIIMPAYNAKNTISASIESVIKQTYQKFELIIIDDGSTDNTYEYVLNSFSDLRIKIKKIKNSGVANARNTGIENSKGEFISFLDSDDIWDPNFLFECVRVFQMKKEIDFVYTFYKIFKNNINKSIRGLQNRYKFVNNPFYRILIYDYVPLSSSMVKRKVVDDIGLFNKRYFGTEDWDFFIRVINRYKIEFISLPLMYYREHDKGISKNISRQFKNVYKVVLNSLKSYKIPFWVRYLIIWEFKRGYVLANFSRKKYNFAFCQLIKLILKNPLFLPSYIFLFHGLYRKRLQSMIG